MTGDPVSPESNTEKMIDSVDKVLQPLNLPNTFSRWRALRGITFGIVVLFIGIVISVVMIVDTKGHQLTLALILFAFVGGMGATSLVFSSISYQQLKKGASNQPPYTHFQTATATTYAVPFDLKSAVVDPGEGIANWFGPVTNASLTSGSYQVISREVDTQAVNTLLFTSNQVIGLMLGPDDVKRLRGSGPVKSVANEVLKYAGEGGFTKGVQFEALNANHWDEMVQSLSAQPLEEALSNHLTYGLPYGKIQSVVIKDHLINPGFTIHLTDGKHLRYATFRKDRLPEVANYLKQFVKVA